jgi:Na+-translocating ferredoxin:NAD+ oxidoreductase RnfC subunit
VIIANGAECEPLLRVDQQLMAQYPDEVVAGLELALKATGAKKGIIAFKKKYHGAINALSAAIKGKRKLSLFLLDNFYPAGDEHVLFHEVTEKLVPEGGIPLEAGAVVQNVGTLINIYRASQGQPVVDRAVTIGGAVKTPVTLNVPVGTMVNSLIQAAGGVTIPDPVVLMGGPMMGVVVTPSEAAIAKTCSGIIVLPASTPGVRSKQEKLSTLLSRMKSACCQCLYCSELCPRQLLGHRLEPHKINRAASGLNTDPKVVAGAMLCCECGVCESYACLMSLSPRRVIQELKKSFAQKGFINPLHRSDIKPHPARKSRRIPTSRLIRRLGLKNFDVPAPFSGKNVLPDRVELELKQHVGTPAEPVVKKGGRVKRGDLVAEIPDKALGARVHASIDGTVISVLPDRVVIKAAARRRR